MRTASKPRPAKPAPPRTARLVLTISGVSYVVRPVEPERLPPGATRGFVLTRVDARLGRVRHLIVAGPRWLACSCGDHKYRHRSGPLSDACKHVSAARATGLV